MDPEQFIDRFLRIESREIIDMTLKQSLRSVVDGFKNLDDFGTIIKTYGEFRSAEEGHLTLPEPRTEQVRVPLGPDQEDKYGELVRKLGASDAWLTRWWPRVEKQVRTGLARSTAEQTYPLVVGGILTLASGKALAEGELLAPNLAGWQRFLELAPALKRFKAGIWVRG